MLGEMQRMEETLRMNTDFLVRPRLLLETLGLCPRESLLSVSQGFKEAEPVQSKSLFPVIAHNHVSRHPRQSSPGRIRK